MRTDAIYEALIYILEYIQEQTLGPVNETDGHPTRIHTDNLIREQEYNEYPNG